MNEDYLLVDTYFKAKRIRMIELGIANRYSEQQMRCPVHLSLGQELNAANITQFLTKQDYMVSTHRSHAHYLAKGGDLKAMISELYGKSTGCSGGYGGSMHLVDLSCGFLGSTSIVAGTIPVGVGAGFYLKLQKKKNIVVICHGDAAIEEGVFHESANFAALHKLPALFLLEDNDSSCYTPKSKRQPNRFLENLGEAHGLEVFSNPSVFEMRDIIEICREGSPVLIIQNYLQSTGKCIFSFPV